MIDESVGGQTTIGPGAVQLNVSFHDNMSGVGNNGTGGFDTSPFGNMTSKDIFTYFMRNQCMHSLMAQPYPNDGRVYCNATFDDWSCWNYTLAGTTAYQDCPKFLAPVYGPPSGQASKVCLKDGSWFTHPDTGRLWSNYTLCSSKPDDLHTVIYVYYSGYGLSIFFVLLALGLFTYFKQLRCSRVTLHKNLFVTYILSGIAWILLYALLDDPVILKSNPSWCQVLHVVTQYLTLCNYAWMFCEGFYLHTLIVLTFTNDKKLLIACYIIGWVIPIIPTSIYSGLRGSNTDLRRSCWINETSLNWIFYGFVAVSLIVNFIFLINILRILLSKLRAVNTNEAHQTRRTVRATLILIPLLGLQYLVIPFRPDKGSPNIRVYEITSAVLTSYQGVFVALLFCFFNGEVLGIIRRKWKQVREHLNSGDMKRSNTFNVSLLETTYVPKSVAEGSSICKNNSSPEKDYADVCLKESVPYQPVKKVQVEVQNGQNCQVHV